MQVVASVHTVLCTSSMVIFLSLREQEMLMCEYVSTYHNVSFREREREKEKEKEKERVSCTLSMVIFFKSACTRVV